MEITAAILAGGASKRMGFNKAFIEIDGEPIIERSLKVLEPLSKEIFIVANDVLTFERLGVRVIADIRKGCGSLGGVHTALYHSQTGFTFITACDMPHINYDVIKGMLKDLKDSGKYDALVPHIQGRLHPMHAFYSRRCIKEIEKMLDEGNLRITELFSRIRTKTLDEDFFGTLPAASSVCNVNTKDDLSALKNTLKVNP